eukprot:CAMPEP_0194759932 /NCGR_PEP_ID=MMETSP0323_2-20130528/12910_1 /TAXON_ID=2866 ORGANISM="Crypthecodinium cohnii, Strain Seligo" /NCGR_SAMPLE_ID=MMETSP0323_2 /ASSEMBLY_ACC=CAM_ASM_000346 /LENGTH=76 /DNA_ID=CAMNT_0039680923 /DNA_START=387 /DNA_END=617 /DNA_ORIENTATION=-
MLKKVLAPSGGGCGQNRPPATLSGMVFGSGPGCEALAVEAARLGPVLVAELGLWRTTRIGRPRRKVVTSAGDRDPE